MRVCVMAAGGIGGYYGGLLARAGHDVIFVARGSHLAALKRDGLHVRAIDGEFHLKPVKSTDKPAEIGTVDLILFGVKTYDTETAARSIQPIVGESTMVLTFQNGVESVEIIGAIVGANHVIPAPTQIETFIASPGRIAQVSEFRRMTIGEPNGGVTPRIEQLASLFRPFGIDMILAPDMPRPVWNKFLLLAPASGLTTLARTEPFELFKLDEACQALKEGMEEIVRVASAEGIELEDGAARKAFQFVTSWKPGQKPSMLKDIERGNRLEIDALSGAVVRMGEKHGIPTPVHLTIYTGLKPVDDRNRRTKEDPNQWQKS